MLGAVITALVASLAACSTSTNASAGNGKNSVITLTVYSDAVRELGFKEYEKLHPNIHFQQYIALASDPADDLEQKTLLANRVGHGWYDIAFINELNGMAQMQFPTVNYGTNLTNLVPKSIVDGYPKGVLTPCYVNGELVCLRNDNAQNVLWYNAPLMKKWGYSVPQTWAQYQALGEKVAKEHPGTIIGDLENRYGLQGYFWPAECPYEKVIGNMKVFVNMEDPHCVAMAKLLQPLVQDGTVSTLNPVTAAFGKLLKNALMLPAADWFGAYIFDDTFNLPSHTWAAAPTPAWTVGGTHWTGDEGGGTYMISRHCTGSCLTAALAAIEWMTTNTGPHSFQDSSVTTPAYGPALQSWETTGEGGYQNYFYSNPATVFSEMATLIWPDEGYPGYDDAGTFDTTMNATAASGGSLVGELPTWEKQATDLLEAAGYTVVH
jgi:ABC-type glycerol-3-phosphate transport system substrate-binding protein